MPGSAPPPLPAPYPTPPLPSPPLPAQPREGGGSVWLGPPPLAPPSAQSPWRGDSRKEARPGRGFISVAEA